jgi:3-oxoacyl-[acyl-carrier-protein] synthase II
MLMTKAAVGITGWGSASALGFDAELIWERYRAGRPAYVPAPDARAAGWFTLAPEVEQEIGALRRSRKAYEALDRSTLLAIFAARLAARRAGWAPGEAMGVNIGSSRGATQVWENFHRLYERDPQAPLPPPVSPLTTLGNLASWVAQDLNGATWAMSHSMTCGGALHAMINALAWLESGRLRRFLAGGAEAPLTPFTLAQMMALRIYARQGDTAEPFPCRAGDLAKRRHTMMLGEGAACFCLERDPAQPLAFIEGAGFAIEPIESPTSLSANGLCFERAMRMALADAGFPRIDAVATHMPGTLGGDRAEAEALRAIFGDTPPPGVNNKWILGHCLGASGALSMEMALLMLTHEQIVEVPYLAPGARLPVPINRVMVNAAGFGGGALSLILSKP